MTIITEWDNPQHTVIRLTFHKGWTWGDVRQVREILPPMMAEVDYPEIHYIADMRQSDIIPENPLVNLRRFSDNPLEKSGIVVIVGMGIKASTIFNVFINVYRLLAKRVRYVTADTLEEARQIIADEIAKNDLPD